MGGSSFSQKPILSTAVGLKQSQVQASSQMQKSIQLLKATSKDLSSLVQNEIDQNPLLDYERPQESFRESLLVSSSNNIEPVATESPHLCIEQQIRELFTLPDQLQAATILLQYLDSRGVLEAAIVEIAKEQGLSLPLLLQVQKKFQALSPVGIGAKNLQESLIWQLEKKISDASNKAKSSQLQLAKGIVSHFWKELLSNQLDLIEKRMETKAKEIRESIRNIVLQLDFSPIKTLNQEINPLAPKASIAVIPDIMIKKDRGQWAAKIDQENVALNLSLIEALEKAHSKENMQYLRKNRRSGQWFIQALLRRKETLSKIANCLLKEQKSYFEGGELKPLTLSKIAKKIGRANSTLSRAVEGKWICSPRGIEPLKNLFPSDTKNPFDQENSQESNLSKTQLQNVIVSIIESEDKTKPLSDQAISNLLKNKEINCSRRTVAKYRTALNIPKKALRKL